MQLNANKIRQHNSFCAGATQMKRSVMERLAPILPSASLKQMDLLLNNILKEEQYRRISKKEHMAIRKKGRKK